MEFEQTHDCRAMSIILEHNRNIKTSDVETQEVQVVVNVMLKRLFSELTSRGAISTRNQEPFKG